MLAAMWWVGPWLVASGVAPGAVCLLLTLPIGLVAVAGGTVPGVLASTVATGAALFAFSRSPEVPTSLASILLQPGLLGLSGLTITALAGVLRRSVADGRVVHRVLQASEMRHRLALESAGGAFWDWDLRLDVLHRSSRYDELSGACPSTGRGPLGPFSALVHPADVERVASALRAHVKGFSDALAVEFRGAPGKGGPRWLALHGQVAERDASARATRLVGVLSDITARRAQDDRLRQLSAAVEQSPAGITITDRDARIVYANAAFCRNAGLSLEQLSGRNPSLLASGRTPVGTYGTLWRALAQGQTWRGEFVNRRPDGREAIEAAVIGPVRDADGEVSHYVGVQQDVTELRRMNEELDRHRFELEALVQERTAAAARANDARAVHEHFLRIITEAMPAMVSYWDRDMRCRFANAAYRQWFEVDERAIVGMHVEALLGPERHAQARAHLEGVLQCEPQRFQRTMVRSDGQTLHSLVSYVPDLMDGEVRGFTVVATDISDIKRAETTLAALNHDLERRAREAEAATQAKSAFLANMSHEIRTPLNAILGMNHLVLRGATEPDQIARLQRVDTSARHLLQVINDILDLSKVEAGHAELDRVEFDLDDVVDRVAGIVRPRILEKGLELVIDTWSVPRRVVGDETRLSQILINLVGNAVKFTRAGFVRLDGRVLSRGESLLRLRFTVSDSGPGIAPEHQARIFDPFEQADASMTRRFGGTGLGLALVKQYAAMMGGDVGLDSLPGQGSRFRVDVELQAAAQRSVETSLAGHRIVLVDDRPLSRVVLGDGLRSRGAQVDGVADLGEAAGRLSCAGSAPGLVAVSCRSGGWDRASVTRWLEATGCPADVPLVLFDEHDQPVAGDTPRTGRDIVVASAPTSPQKLCDRLVQVLDAAPRAVEVPSSRPQPEPTLRSAHRGRRVLLAEDNFINQELQIALLKAVDLDVVVADDGLEAVRLMEQHSFDLVLMDMQMPNLDGIEATRRIRAAGHREVPIIALTANSFRDDEERCLQAGMNGHLGKPIEPERLYGTLLHWLDRDAMVVERG